MRNSICACSSRVGIGSRAHRLIVPLADRNNRIMCSTVVGYISCRCKIAVMIDCKVVIWVVDGGVFCDHVLAGSETECIT